MIGYTLDDPRVAFDKSIQKYIVETEDGEEYEYNSRTDSWDLSVRIRNCILYLTVRHQG